MNTQASPIATAIASPASAAGLHFVVGFDLGHGDTKLMRASLQSKNGKEPQHLEVQGKTYFPTAIAMHPDLGPLIGEPALTTDGVLACDFGFKRRPDGDVGYEETVGRYAGNIIDEVKKAGQITAENTLFIIGCPTDWAKAETRNLVTDYEKIFREKAGIPQVRVVAESRGALMNAIESRDDGLFIKEMREGRALVIDLGSSTADFTLIDLRTPRAEPYDFGSDLGGTLIDKLILRHTLLADKSRDKVSPILRDNPTLLHKCEFACRKAKEEWFNNPHGRRLINVYLGADETNEGDELNELEFRGSLTVKVMDAILQQPVSDLRDMESLFGQSFASLPGGNWENELRKLLDKAKKVALTSGSGKEPHILLLTGGASRMNFVEAVCKDVFPNAKFVRPPEPEYAIATGLAYWGRVDVRSSRFAQATKQLVNEKLDATIREGLENLFGSLATKLTNDVFDNVVKPKLSKWQHTSESTGILKKNLAAASKTWGKSETVRRIVNHQLKDMLVKVAEDLNEKHLSEIAKQYSIPNPGGALNTSAEIKDLFQGDQGEMAVTQLIADLVDEFLMVVEQQQEELFQSIAFWTCLGIVGVLILSGIGAPIAIAIAAIAWFSGLAAAEAALEGRDLPSWVKETLDIEKTIEGTIKEKQQETVDELRSQLSNKTELTKSIIDTGRKLLDDAVMRRVSEARVFL